MSKRTTNDSISYQTPQVSEVNVYTEGILCISEQSGETTDLTKEDLGDIWY